MKKLPGKSKNTMLSHFLMCFFFILFSAFHLISFDYAHSNTPLEYANNDAKTAVMCELTCPEDVSIFCNQDPNLKDDLGQLTTGEVTLTNCEPGINVIYEDSTVYFGPCVSPQAEIYRKWKVLDENSNELENCTQIITVESWGAEDIEFPEDVVLFDLMDCLDIQSQAHLIRPEETGGVTLNGHPIFNANTQCEIEISATDEYRFRCPGSVEIIRTWHVQNMCVSNSIAHNQSIKILNEPGPVVIDCPEDFTLSVDASGCTASGDLPIPPNLQDLCDSIKFSAETLDGGTLLITGSADNGDLSVFAVNFAPGLHHVQYTISDNCDSLFNCEFEITVPEITPNAVLKQNLVIELTSSSTNPALPVKVFALDLDQGSNNGCIPIKLELRRDSDLCNIPGNATYNDDGHTNDGDSDPNSPNYDPDGGEFIQVCCEDLYNELYDVNGDGIKDLGYLKVWLRVWWDSNQDETIGNDGDSYVEVWGFIKVEDKLDPAIVCPPDITVQCADDFLNPDVTGWAEGFSSCGSAPTEFTDIITNLNQCNVGTVRKRWNVKGRTDIFCDQIITVEAENENLSFDIISEQSVSFDHCPEPSEIPFPIIPKGVCETLEYVFDADTSVFEGGACYIVRRNYVFINYCRYDPNNPFWEMTPDFSDGYAEITQIINVSDENKPVVKECGDFIVAINDNEDEDNDGIYCEAKTVLTNSAFDINSIYCSSDWLKWTVLVDLFGDGTNDIEYSSFLPPGDDVFNDTNGNGVPDIYLKPTMSDELIFISLPDIAGGLSNHKVSWRVVDGCNNVTSCNNDFFVLDQTPPSTICQDTSVVDISQTEPTTIWAIDYISDATDFCTETENLRYTFSELSPEDDPLYDPNLRSSSKELDLNDINNSPFKLPIYTWDERDNFATCETFLIINTALTSKEEATSGFIQDNEVLPFTMESVNGNSLNRENINALHQNHPNPFRFSTTIQFDLAEDAQVRLSFINATNARTQEVEIDGKRGSNTYSLNSDLLPGQGLYYYRLTANNHVETKKMILLH